MKKVKRKLKSKGEWWMGIKNLPASLMADKIGLRLFNSIDMAARRVGKKGEKQAKVVTVVAHGDADKITLRDIMRVNTAICYLSLRVRESHISFDLYGRWAFPKKMDKAEVAVAATHGDNLPLADANLAPIRKEYRRLLMMKQAREKKNKKEGKKKR